MGAECQVMGLFTDEDRAASAIMALKKTPWHLKQVHSPVPSHKLSDALNLKKSKVGYFTLVGGIIGFFLGFALAMFTAAKWNLIVGGKPVIALVPFVIVGFEFTILFAVLGNVIGLLTQGGPVYSTITPPLLVYNTLFKEFSLGRAAATSFLMTLVLLVAMVFYLRAYNRSEEELS